MNDDSRGVGLSRRAGVVSISSFAFAFAVRVHAKQPVDRLNHSLSYPGTVTIAGDARSNLEKIAIEGVAPLHAAVTATVHPLDLTVPSVLPRTLGTGRKDPLPSLGWRGWCRGGWPRRKRKLDFSLGLPSHMADFSPYNYCAARNRLVSDGLSSSLPPAIRQNFLTLAQVRGRFRYPLSTLLLLRSLNHRIMHA